MKEILIGRNGNQPFKITAEGVSAHHAQLTIRDDGTWILKDLNSKNGTFILDKDRHRFERVDARAIDASMLIRLGPDDTILCCQFMARRLLKTEGDYTEEFQELRSKWGEFQAKKEKLEKQITRKSYLPVGFSVVLIGLTCLIPESWSVDVRMNAMRAVMLIPALLSPFLNTSSRKQAKALSQEIKETFVCPNPACGQPLSETEVKKGLCTKCKAHI